MRMNAVGMSAPAIAALLLAAEAGAKPELRVQVTQRGDFQLMGNTLGQNCAPSPIPVVGAIGDCGVNVNDSAIDVYWRADSPGDGEAEADIGISAAQARSTAILELPPDAQVTHAFLYWAATLDAPGMDEAITLERPGSFIADIDGAGSCTPGKSYQCSADVTALVQTHGVGAYRVGGVDSAVLTNKQDLTHFAGWWLAVLYYDAGEPVRNLALFDGFDLIALDSSQDLLLEGFKVPNGGIAGKLGVIAFEGDADIMGDQLFFGGGAALANANNPVNNFFNGTRSRLNSAVSVVGDLPQLKGTQGSMWGVDLDIVDITSKLSPGQTQAQLTASTTNDGYFLGGFITSISDLRPDFAASLKSAVDVNGGLLVSGDELEYTIAASNAGSDAAIDVVLTDALPVGVTYVPGSLEVATGPNAGAKSDAAGDDQGEYDAGTRTIVVRLGMDADAVDGGTLAIDETSSVKFRVTIDADTKGEVANQGVIAAAGLLGAEPALTPTGDGKVGQPTAVFVDACETDAQCTDPALPRCDVDGDPVACVGCLDDADCPGQTCDAQTQACVCVPSGDEVCDGFDNDCDDAVDEDCECSGDGDCGDSDSGRVCEAGACVDGCRGTGNGCPDLLVCTSEDDSVGVCVDEGTTDTATTEPATTGDTPTSGGDDTGGDPATGGDAATGDGDTTTGGPDGGTSGESGDSASTGGSSAGEGSEGGCGCDAQDRGQGGLLALGLVGLAVARRRRR